MPSHTANCVYSNRVVYLHTHAHTRAGYRWCVSHPCTHSFMYASTGQQTLVYTCGAAGTYTCTPVLMHATCTQQRAGMPVHTRLRAEKIHATAYPRTHSCVPPIGCHSLYTCVLYAKSGRRVCTSVHNSCCAQQQGGAHTHVHACVQLQGGCPCVGCAVAHVLTHACCQLVPWSYTHAGVCRCRDVP